MILGIWVDEGGGETGQYEDIHPGTHTVDVLGGGTYSKMCDTYEQTAPR
jgi:hypothetical protein